MRGQLDRTEPGPVHMGSHQPRRPDLTTNWEHPTSPAGAQNWTGIEFFSSLEAVKNWIGELRVCLGPPLM